MIYIKYGLRVGDGHPYLRQYHSKKPIQFTNIEILFWVSSLISITEKSQTYHFEQLFLMYFLKCQLGG
jgi:hypothetical protein